MRRNHIVRGGGLAAVALAMACRDAAGPGRVGEPWGVLVVAGDGQEGAVRGELDDSVAVRVLDVGRRPVAGVEVRWSVEEGGGSVSPATGVTDAAGVARAAWTMGSAPETGVLRAVAAGRLRTEARSVSRPRVELAIVWPRADATVVDELYVRVQVVERATAVDSVTATVQGIRMRLERGDDWTGTLPLGSIPAGAAEVRVAVYSSTGDTAAVTVPFTRNPSLRVRVVRPNTQTLYSASAIPVWAECMTTVRGPCTVEVRTASSAVPVLQGTLEVQGTLALSESDCQPGGPCLITFTARDAGGLAVSEVRAARLGVPAGLTEIASAGTRAWDVDGSRVLFVDAGRDPAVVAVRDLSSGQESVITTIPHEAVPLGGWLHPQGAVFVLQMDRRPQVYDWRAGRLESLGTAYAWPEGVVVRGRWAVRSLRDGSVVRRDLYTGDDLLVGQGTGSVAPNGDVAYITRSASSTEVYRFRDGVRTLLATCPVTASVPGCSLPLTDGSRVLYQAVSFGRMLTYHDLRMVVGNGAPESLGQYQSQFPWTVYAADGWIVFRSEYRTGFVTPDGTRWLFDYQPPSQVLRGVSALGPAGIVVSEGTVYRPEYTQPGVTAPGVGRFEFHGGELLLFSGPAVYRVSY